MLHGRPVCAEDEAWLEGTFRRKNTAGISLAVTNGCKGRQAQQSPHTGHAKAWGVEKLGAFGGCPSLLAARSRAVSCVLIVQGVQLMIQHYSHPVA